MHRKLIHGHATLGRQRESVAFVDGNKINLGESQ